MTFYILAQNPPPLSLSQNVLCFILNDVRYRFQLTVLPLLAPFATAKGKEDHATFHIVT